MTDKSNIPGPGAPLPTGDAKATAVRSMFDTLAPRYDLVNRIMTFRLDVRWRKRTVRSLALPVDSKVLDLACGTGDLCRDLKSAGHHPIGMDLSWGEKARICARCWEKESFPLLPLEKFLRKNKRPA